MTMGEKIRAARKAAGMTQQALAEKLGIPYQSIGQWERNLRRPKMDSLRRLADALDVSVIALVDSKGSDMFYEGFNRAFETARVLHAETDDEYESAIDDAMDILQSAYFLDQAGQRAAVECIGALGLLNQEGQSVAVERVKELTEIRKYQKNAQETKTPAPGEAESGEEDN